MLMEHVVMVKASPQPLLLPCKLLPSICCLPTRCHIMLIMHMAGCGRHVAMVKASLQPLLLLWRVHKDLACWLRAAAAAAAACRCAATLCASFAVMRRDVGGAWPWSKRGPRCCTSLACL